MFPVKQLFFKDEIKNFLACFALVEFTHRHLCYDNEEVINVMF